MKSKFEITARFEMNRNERLAEQVISSVLQKQEIAEDDLSVDALTLEREYGLAEVIGTEHVDLQQTDLVVVLSGRSGFAGAYLEDADKYQLCPNQFDASDTARRLMYGVKIAKQSMRENKSDRPVFIYFNGLKRQNDELRTLLIRDGSFSGLPAHYFIIDSIPFDNTLGQVIGLSKYLHHNWLIYARQFKLDRPPNIVFCSSSYHVPRIALGVGCNSPLLSSVFWQKQPELLRQLNPEMRAYVLNPGDTLKRASIMVLGCDRKMALVPFSQKDLFGDMQARVNYSSRHRLSSHSILASIAATPGENIVTVFNACMKSACSSRLSFFARVDEQAQESYSDDEYQESGARPGSSVELS